MQCARSVAPDQAARKSSGARHGRAKEEARNRDQKAVRGEAKTKKQNKKQAADGLSIGSLNQGKTKGGPVAEGRRPTVCKYITKCCK